MGRGEEQGSYLRERQEVLQCMGCTGNRRVALKFVCVQRKEGDRMVNTVYPMWVRGIQVGKDKL